LDAVPGLTEREVDSLKRHWIVSADALVAAAATPGGLTSLADALDVSQSDAAHIVAAARAALPDDVAAALEAPVDTSEFGLGAVPAPRESEADDA
jgi:hypothetical protein